MMDYYSASKNYNIFTCGAARMEIIKKFIEKADLEKNYNCAVRFRYDYMHEAMFYDDVFKLFIIFPEYLKIFDEYNDKIIYPDKDIDLIYSYSWVISNAAKFYQISVEDINKYVEDFKKRLIERGYSLKIYYEVLSVYEDIDEDKYKKSFNKYINEKGDELNKSKKHELFDIIYFELYHGSFEKAIKLIGDFSTITDRIQCSQGIEFLYNNILYYYVKNNIVKENIEKLSKYEKIICRKMKNLLSSLECVNTLLNYYAIVDINKGIKLFRNYLKWNLKIKTPIEKFYFELSVYRLFMSVKEKQNRKIIKLNLDSNFKLYKEDGIYSIDEIINYFKNDITYIAEKFDKRNGNDNFIKEVKDNGFLN